MISGIYLISSLHNNKYYVGQAINIKRRFNEHLSKLRTDKHYSKYLQRHFNKYGESDLVFSILEIVDNPNKYNLSEREQYWIDTLKPEFNYCVVVNSNLHTKRENSKYYTFDKKSNLYKTFYRLDGKTLYFNTHHLEKDAIDQANIISKLTTKQEIIQYHKECKLRPKCIKRNSKYYSYNKLNKKWAVYYKRKHYGYYITEFEAINKVNEILLNTKDI